MRDPMWAPPHDAEVHALVRVCDLENIPLATNPASAEALIRYLQRLDEVAVAPLKPRTKSCEAKAGADDVRSLIFGYRSGELSIVTAGLMHGAFIDSVDENPERYRQITLGQPIIYIVHGVRNKCPYLF